MNRKTNIDKILELYPFERMRSEKTLVAHIYKTTETLYDMRPAGTAIVGILSNALESRSCFHRLAYDEMWHVYGGDPFFLYELSEDGILTSHLMGNNPLNGEKSVHTVAGGMFQAAELITGGEYAFYGCTMAPGFTVDCFTEADRASFLKKMPQHTEIITRLTVFKEI
ncbi:hypothetical protein AwErysi_07580 [Erysipelotrichaceae bacterium]|nr:hypothetical protein AwErysi_07580 [Erysipelotrichaceae bacterium]